MLPQRMTALTVLSLFVLILIPAAMAQSTPSVEEYKLPNGTAADAMCVDSRGSVWLAQSSPATSTRSTRQQGLTTLLKCP